MIYRDPRVSTEYVSRSYIAPERNAGDQTDAAALRILAELLGGGTTSYLTEKLQFEQELAVYTGAFYSGVSLDDTTFNIIVVPQPSVSLEDAARLFLPAGGSDCEFDGDAGTAWRSSGPRPLLH